MKHLIFALSSALAISCAEVPESDPHTETRVEAGAATAGIMYRTPYVLPDTDSVIPLGHDIYAVPAVTEYRTYTLPRPTVVGQGIYIINTGYAPFDVDIARQGWGGLAMYFTYSEHEPLGWVLLVADKDLIWRGIAWGGNAKDGVANYP